jgi:hypothetical protein
MRAIGPTIRAQRERIVEKQQAVDFEKQQPLGTAFLRKPLKGNKRRGAYLNFHSKHQSSSENGRDLIIACIKSEASIIGVAAPHHRHCPPDQLRCSIC